MSDFDEEIRLEAERLAGVLRARGWVLATAESCTGGWIAKAVTDLPGSSDWFGYGLVSYSNDAKRRLLGVAGETLADEGAVSEAVVLEMARGALAASGADVAVAVSGIAGPTGGSRDKPVGTVWFAWATAAGETASDCRRFAGNREAVRARSVLHALVGVRERSEGG